MNYKFTTPIKMPRGTHYGSNYWMFESKKIHRCVTAYSNLEYENLLTLEMNPEVEYYCEQPYSAIDSFIICLDMYGALSFDPVCFPGIGELMESIKLSGYGESDDEYERRKRK